MDPFTKILSRKLRDEVQDVMQFAGGGGGDIDDRLNALRGEAAGMLAQFSRPPVDVLRTDDEMVVLVEVPGYRKREIDVLLPESGEIDRIRVKGKRVPEEGEPLYEERTRSFDRTIPLPEPCEAGEVSASLRRGVLRIELECAPGTFGKRVEIE